MVFEGKKMHSHINNTWHGCLCVLFALDEEYRSIHKTVDFDSAIARTLLYAHIYSASAAAAAIVVFLLLSHILPISYAAWSVQNVYKWKRDKERELNFSCCLFDVAFSEVDSVLNAVVCHALGNKFVVSLNTIQPQTNERQRRSEVNKKKIQWNTPSMWKKEKEEKRITFSRSLFHNRKNVAAAGWCYLTLDDGAI